MNSRPGSHLRIDAKGHAALAFDLLCQASVGCASLSPAAASAAADRIEEAQGEIRCAAYLISARLAPSGRRRAERRVWERFFESPPLPTDSVNGIVAMLEHAQDTIEHLLSTYEGSEDEHLASVHVSFACHALACARS